MPAPPGMSLQRQSRGCAYYHDELRILTSGACDLVKVKVEGGVQGLGGETGGYIYIYMKLKSLTQLCFILYTMTLMSADSLNVCIFVLAYNSHFANHTLHFYFRTTAVLPLL